MNRNVLGVVVPLTWLVASIAPFVLAWHHLPEPLAVHWSLGGEPNGAMPRIAAIALHGGFALLAAIGAFVVTRPGEHVRGVRTGVGIATFTGSMFATIALAVVAANYDAADWRAAHVHPLVFAIVLAIPVACAAIASRAARSLVTAAPHEIEPLATVGLASNERAVWTGSAHSRVFAVGTVAAIAIGALAFTLGSLPAALICGAIAVVCVPFIQLRVRVDDRGLSIGFGPLHWPSVRVPLAEIRSARQLDIAPLQHGGWGYRGSLKVFGRAAAIVRGGDGLQLDLDDDRTFIVSTDDAATAAGLLNDLVRRRR